VGTNLNKCKKRNVLEDSWGGGGRGSQA